MKVGMRVPREWVMALFVLVVLFTALLISYPWEVLATGSVFYLAAIPLAYAHYKRLERTHAVAGTDIAAEPVQEEDRPGRLN
jgi:CDP-diacylglycerol--serine O-phosphatidyltransferase